MWETASSFVRVIIVYLYIIAAFEILTLCTLFVYGTKFAGTRYMQYVHTTIRPTTIQEVRAFALWTSHIMLIRFGAAYSGLVGSLGADVFRHINTVCHILEFFHVTYEFIDLKKKVTDKSLFTLLCQQGGPIYWIILFNAVMFLIVDILMSAGVN
jgi:hypothetical protein